MKIITTAFVSFLLLTGCDQPINTTINPPQKKEEEIISPELQASINQYNTLRFVRNAQQIILAHQILEENKDYRLGKANEPNNKDAIKRRFINAVEAQNYVIPNDGIDYYYLLEGKNLEAPIDQYYVLGCQKFEGEYPIIGSKKLNKDDSAAIARAICDYSQTNSNTLQIISLKN